MREEMLTQADRINARDIAKRKLRNNFLDFSIMLVTSKKQTIIFFVAGVLDDSKIFVRGYNQGDIHLLDIKDEEIYFCDDYEDRYDCDIDDYEIE